MGLEVASFLSELNQSWPLDTDSATQGDDHLRLIKSVLRSVFPGAGGNGFSQQILATEAEINFLQGVTSPIADAIAGSAFPAGTVLPFYNAAPPLGWTLVDQPTSRMLVVGAVVGGSSGGTHSPLINSVVASHTHAASGSTTVNGQHSHNINWEFVIPAAGGTGNISGGTGDVSISAISVDGSGEHSHDLNFTVDANVGASWEPLYCGLILCSKD